MTERSSIVTYIRQQAPLMGDGAVVALTLADAIERGEHRPVPATSRTRLGTNRRYGCGHPRTPDNTVSVGKAGVRCKTCRRAMDRASRARKAGRLL